MATKSDGADRVDGRMGGAAAAIMANRALSLLQRLADAAERALTALETEPDLDNTYIVGGLLAGAAVQTIDLPRTLKHVEITLTVALSNVNLATTPYSVALLQGNVALTEAQQRHNVLATIGPSNAIAVGVGSGVTVRDNLDGSGKLTVYFSGAGTAYANVRIRDLDKTQARARRT